MEPGGRQIIRSQEVPSRQVISAASGLSSSGSGGLREWHTARMGYGFDLLCYTSLPMRDSRQKRDFLSVADFSATEMERLIALAMLMKHGRTPQVLRGLSIALLFEKPSLRTRVSFELAVRQLGGYAMYLSPAEVGLGKRESVADVARVLARYVDGIVCRTFAQATLEELARWADVPVINALSDHEHPCQALGDMLTVREHKGKLTGVTIAYIGDGNNCAHSLFLAAILTGANFRIATPAGYKMDAGIVKKGKRFARLSGSQLVFTEDPALAVKGADVIYTDVWTSMGKEAEAEKRRKAFAGFQVSQNLVSLANRDVILMHPLPAHHGEEVAPGILETPNSVVLDQAENRLHIQKAILAELFQT